MLSLHEVGNAFSILHCSYGRADYVLALLFVTALAEAQRGLTNRAGRAPTQTNRFAWSNLAYSTRAIVTTWRGSSSTQQIARCDPIASALHSCSNGRSGT